MHEKMREKFEEHFAEYEQRLSLDALDAKGVDRLTFQLIRDIGIPWKKLVDLEAADTQGTGEFPRVMAELTEASNRLIVWWLTHVVTLYVKKQGAAAYIQRFCEGLADNTTHMVEKIIDYEAKHGDTDRDDSPFFSKVVADSEPSDRVARGTSAWVVRDSDDESS